MAIDIVKIPEGYRIKAGRDVEDPTSNGEEYGNVVTEGDRIRIQIGGIGPLELLEDYPTPAARNARAYAAAQRIAEQASERTRDNLIVDVPRYRVILTDEQLRNFSRNVKNDK